jgi:hypothetical protein
MDKLGYDIQGTGRWGRVRTFQAPFDFVGPEGLVLKPAALFALLPILRIANIRASKTTSPTEIKVKIGMKALMVHAGKSRGLLSRGRDQARDLGYLSTETSLKKYKAFGTNEYSVCDHGEPLVTQAGKTVYYGNDIRYMSVPTCFISDVAPWSLSSVTGSELAVYISALWLASEARSNEFTTDKTRWQDISRLSSKTFRNTLESPVLRYLLHSEGDQDISIALLDPYTGQKTHPITNDQHDPANYFITGPDGDRDRRMNFNYTPEQTESILKSCDLRYRLHNDNFVMNCIFHDETKGSLNVHTSGYFKCFGCGVGRGKHMVDIVMQSLKLTGESAIKHLAAVTGIPEERLQFREFKSKAVAVYPYFDERGDRVKDKVRFAGKRFQWRTYIKRKKPLLYNAHLVQFATTVILVEGEKDADAVTNLYLKDQWNSDIIGTTSGSATSWKDGHAVALRRKRVLILPDNDAPGEQYGNQVLTSCMAHGIDWQLHSLPYGVNDVSDYLTLHGADELVTRIGSHWFATPEPEPEYLAA